MGAGAVVAVQPRSSRTKKEQERKDDTTLPVSAGPGPEASRGRPASIGGDRAVPEGVRVHR